MRIAFDVRAYDVRCTCIRRSVYAAIKAEDTEETGVEAVA